MKYIHPHARTLANLTTSCLFGIFAPNALAERQESFLLYEGTPGKVEWSLLKSNPNNSINGKIYFKEGKNPLETLYQFSNWPIPAFDTHGGTRIATGFRVDYEASLQATFHADAETTHHRKIETVSKSINATAMVFDGTYEGAYKTYSYAGSYEEVPANRQTSTMTWNIDQKIQEKGWVLRPLVRDVNKDKFYKIIKGGTSVHLEGDVSWDASFNLNRRSNLDNSPVTVQADAATSQWEIPNEFVADRKIGNFYPVDDLGRSVYAFGGLPGFPIGSWQPQHEKPTINKKTGASNPIKVSIVYFYTQIGDSDYNQMAYTDAGAYSEEFQYIDNRYGFQQANPTALSFNTLPGDKELQYAEFEGTMANDYYGRDPNQPIYGILLDQGESQYNLKGFSAGYHFKWADVDRNGTLSMEEYRNYRFTIDKLVKAYRDLSEILPDTNWATIAPPESADSPQTPTFTWQENMVFSTVDVDKSSFLTKTEWELIYPKKKNGTFVRDNSFETLDANNDKKLTREEILTVSTDKMPAVWKIALGRAELFGNLAEMGEVKGKLNLKALRFGWNPGTLTIKIKKDLIRMSNGKMRLTVTFRDFLSWNSVPMRGYNTGKAIREIRRKKFSEIRGEYAFDISKKEFQKLFVTGTPQIKMDKAWNIATNTQKGSKAPTTLSQQEFKECRLVGTMIK
jgi:hypothetical protein